MKPRIILADDHVLLLDAFEKLLTADFDVIAKVTDGHSLVSVANAERPDVVVLDIMMPQLNGLDAARQLRQAHPEICIVFLTMIEDPELAAEAIRLGGGCGYVLKRSAASELVTAIHQVLRKRSYVTPLITGELVGVLLNHGEHPDRQQLTSRQREVLQLLAEGHSMKEVAQILNVAPRTVAFHKYRMMQQLHITSTAQLVQFAVKHHIVS